MSAFDVLDRFGTGALLRFLLAVAVFVTLHLLRLPMLLLARLLEVGMRRIDTYLTGAATTATTDSASDPDAAAERPPGAADACFRMPVAAGAQ